jgi:hypothetical protein
MNTFGFQQGRHRLPGPSPARRTTSWARWRPWRATAPQQDRRCSPSTPARTTRRPPRPPAPTSRTPAPSSSRASTRPGGGAFSPTTGPPAPCSGAARAAGSARTRTGRRSRRDQERVNRRSDSHPEMRQLWLRASRSSWTLLHWCRVCSQPPRRRASPIVGRRRRAEPVRNGRHLDRLLARHEPRGSHRVRFRPMGRADAAPGTRA